MIKELEKIFNALSDRNRLRILALLNSRPFCVCELQAVLGLAQSTISEHLQILKSAGLVMDQKNSFWTDYFLAPQKGGGREFLKIFTKGVKNDSIVKKDLKNSRKINRSNLCQILRRKND